MIDALTDDLAKRIRAARSRANLSQSEMAEQLGVSLRTIQNWEYGGAMPRPKHRRLLAEFVNQHEQPHP